MKISLIYCFNLFANQRVELNLMKNHSILIIKKLISHVFNQYFWGLIVHQDPFDITDCFNCFVFTMAASRSSHSNEHDAFCSYSADSSLTLLHPFLDSAVPNVAMPVEESQKI